MTASDRAAALLAKPARGALQRGGDRGRVLVCVQFAVGQAAVIIQDADHDRLARPAGFVLFRALTGGPMPGPVELGQAERVDVQQRPRVGPLIAAMRAPLTARATTDPVTLEHLPTRRAMPAGQPRQPHRTPVGLLACVEDRLLLLAG
jgi:hypothetical protein